MQFYGQLVIGPSGSGKTTYCRVVQEMAAALRREVLVVNLDPAAEHLPYAAHADIRQLVTLGDVTEEHKLGPNGGLVYCMEYLLENIDWLEEQLAGAAPDDYFLFDCPGQLELYSHLDVMAAIGRRLGQNGFALASVCLLDSTFLTDEMKFVSGCLVTLSFVVALGLPALTVLSKCDLCPDRRALRQLLGDRGMLSSGEESDEEAEEPADPDLTAATRQGRAAQRLEARLEEGTRLAQAPDAEGRFAARHAELQRAFKDIVG